LEGLIGPVIDELTFKEAMDIGILAAPDVRLIPVEAYTDYETRTYADIYDKAIVNNKDRNRLVLKEIKSLNREGLTTLTYVQKIEHIRNLLAMAEEMDVSLIDVQGKVDSETRLDIKHKLERKEIQNVVSTVVWREGINVKSLNSIIIAGGGKNEKDLIQACGRGARKDEGKNEFVIVDFVDSAKYLSQHFCERLKTYVKKGWL
jgi:superfamily II DNA or RNA helicase